MNQRYASSYSFVLIFLCSESSNDANSSNSDETAPPLLVKVSDSVPEPGSMSAITSSFPFWDPTPTTPQIMPTLPTDSQQTDSSLSSDSVHLNGIEVTFPVASDSGVDVIQQISATINQTDEARSQLSDTDTPAGVTNKSSRSTLTTFEVVKQLRSLNNNIVQVIQAKPSSEASTLPETVSSPATNSGVSEEAETSTKSTSCTQPLVATSREPLSSSTKEDATVVPVQDLGIESEEAVTQMQKLLEQAVTNYVPGGTYSPIQDINVVVSEPVGESASNAVMNVELSQPPHLSYQSNIEAVVEMLLETAKSLSGLINPEEVPKSPVVNTEVTSEGTCILSASIKGSNLEPVCKTVVCKKQTTVDQRPLTTQQDSSSEQLPSANDYLPGPSGLHQDSTNSTISPNDGKEAQGLHANKEIQSLLDALLSSAESQGSSDKKDSKNTESPGAKIHKCPECDKYFPRLSSLKRHVLLHMDTRPFQCDQCEANYKSASQLNRHKRLHTGEKPAKCEFCNKDFRTYNELYVHRRTHTGEKPFECQYCGKCFSTRGYRNTHQRIHTGEKRFECDYCGMKFTESSARRVHRFTHTGETPYKCKDCGRGFTQASNLNKHMKTIHSNEKPFKCQDCAKSFSIKQELRRHFQRVHSTDKPHKCSICDKRYAIFSDLTHHMQSHVFRCAKCGDKFKDSKELERHIIEVCVVPSDDDPIEEDENGEKEIEEVEVPAKNVSKRGKKGAPSGSGKGKSNAKRPQRIRTELFSAKKRKTVESHSQDDGTEQTGE